MSPETERKIFLDKLFDFMQRKGTSPNDIYCTLPNAITSTSSPCVEPTYKPCSHSKSDSVLQAILDKFVGAVSIVFVFHCSSY